MHPPSVYTDQSPDALRLTLVNGELDMKRFMCLASATASGGDMSVTATVIGASHVITYTCGDETQHEIFACESHGDGSAWHLEDLVQNPVHESTPGREYYFEATRFHWSDPEPSVLAELMTPLPRTATTVPIHVMQEFPVGKCHVPPKTVIRGRLDLARREVTVSTAHSYPNVRGLVLSHTRVTYTGGI